MAWLILILLFLQGCYYGKEEFSDSTIRVGSERHYSLSVSKEDSLAHENSLGSIRFDSLYVCTEVRVMNMDSKNKTTLFIINSNSGKEVKRDYRPVWPPKITDKPQAWTIELDPRQECIIPACGETLMITYLNPVGLKEKVINIKKPKPPKKKPLSIKRQTESKSFKM